MSAEKLYSEVLEDFQKAEDKAAKIKVLKEHDHKSFREFLEAAFNPAIVFDVEISCVLVYDILPHTFTIAINNSIPILYL